MFGSNLEGSSDFEGSARLLAQHMSKQGITNARFEMDWGHFNYYNESATTHLENWGSKLVALASQGIRPLVLLNANSGAPVPHLQANAIVSTNASNGSRTLCFSMSKSKSWSWNQSSLKHRSVADRQDHASEITID